MGDDVHAPRAIYTAGYEGLDIDTFTRLLTSEAVDCLVDVRFTPRSRKPGFSKTALERRVRDNRVRYVHLPQLGTPTALRRAFHASGDWPALVNGDAEWLSQHPSVLGELERLAGGSTVALLCFEANVERCHRSLLVRRLMQGSLRPMAWKDLSRDGWRALAHP